MANNWPLEQALTCPVVKEPKNQKKTTDHLGKEFPSVSEMCRCWGITRSTYNARIKSGYSKEKALTQPVIQVETAPKKCKDHLGQEFPSQNAMCRYWGTNKDTLKNRMEDLGWSLEKALTTNGVIVPGIGVSDYMGRTFPTITDMCHFYGFLLHDLQGTGCSEKAFLRAVKRRYRKNMVFGEITIKKQLTFPYFMVQYKEQEYVWTLEQILESYHNNRFLPLPIPKLKRLDIQIIEFLPFPDYRLQIGAEKKSMELLENPAVSKRNKLWTVQK